MAEHRLKIWPPYFDAHEQGRKNFEARLDDRNYQVGDVLVLEEWDPTARMYTGRVLPRRVTYILRGAHFGILPGWCVMATKHPAIGWAPEEARG